MRSNSFDRARATRGRSPAVTPSGHSPAIFHCIEIKAGGISMATDRQSGQQAGERSQADLSSQQGSGASDRDMGQRGAQGSSYAGQQSAFEGARGQQGGGAQQSYGRTGQGAGWQNRNPGTQGRGGMYPTQQGATGHPMAAGGFGPFSLLRQLTEEMDRLFEDFATPMWGSGRGGGGGLSQRGGQRGGMQSLWSPHVEMRERNGQLEIEVDLPGLQRGDVEVELEDDQIVVRGERRDQREQNERGFYVSERSYGSFYRVIPLPEGVDTEQAQATFQNGVLRIDVPLPQQRSRARQLQIRDGGSTSGQGGESGRMSSGGSSGMGSGGSSGMGSGGSSGMGSGGSSGMGSGGSSGMGSGGSSGMGSGGSSGMGSGGSSGMESGSGMSGSSSGSGTGSSGSGHTTGTRGSSVGAATGGPGGSYGGTTGGTGSSAGSGTAGTTSGGTGSTGGSPGSSGTGRV
jgi:HSP20 family protein